MTSFSLTPASRDAGFFERADFRLGDPRFRERRPRVEERAAFRAQDFSIAGCIATVGYDGKLKVIEGLVRPEDMPERADAGNDDGTDPGRVDEPVITEPLTTHTDPRARAREETWIGIGLAERAMRAHPWEWADPFGWPNLVSKAQAHAMAPRALVELAVPCRDPQPDG